ncbi:hypothetical protein FQN54_007715 [Arachnomyces sp. PD_36]|nr:hypothetical protein FQN54_007715 [Arachnomyces sp. PD_36]
MGYAEPTESTDTTVTPQEDTIDWETTTAVDPDLDASPPPAPTTGDLKQDSAGTVEFVHQINQALAKVQLEEADDEILDSSDAQGGSEIPFEDISKRTQVVAFPTSQPRWPLYKFGDPRRRWVGTWDCGLPTAHILRYTNFSAAPDPSNQ